MINSITELIKTEGWDGQLPRHDIKILVSERDRLKVANAELASALKWFDLHADSLAADLRSAHRSRGEGGSQWMAEDDRDFRADFRKAIETARAALQAHGPAKPEENGP